MSIPEGATHKAVGPRIDCWYKNINCLGFEFMNQGGSEWLKRDGMPNWPYERIANEQPKPWSGPEDGLPPVGTVCEVKGCMSHYLKWSKVTVFAVRGKTVMFDMEDCRWGQTESHEFRAIQTKEQLRETAIRELIGIAQVDCRVTAARLVDAGFKREVV